MYRIKSILLLSQKSKKTEHFINNFFEFHLANQIVIVETQSECNSYLEFLSNSKNSLCPDIIILELNELLSGGIEFLENFSKLFFENKNEVRLIFTVNSPDTKAIATLQVLGEFEFIKTPSSADVLFNFLISKPPVLEIV